MASKRKKQRNMLKLLAIAAGVFLLLQPKAASPAPPPAPVKTPGQNTSNNAVGKRRRVPLLS